MSNSPWSSVPASSGVVLSAMKDDRFEAARIDTLSGQVIAGQPVPTSLRESLVFLFSDQRGAQNSGLMFLSQLRGVEAAFTICRDDADGWSATITAADVYGKSCEVIVEGLVGPLEALARALASWSAPATGDRRVVTVDRLPALLHDAFIDPLC